MEDILSSLCEGRAKFLSWFLRIGVSKYTLKKIIIQECFTLEGIERQSTEWSRTLTMHLSDKELDRIYKERLQLNKKRSNNPMRKWASDINRLYQPYVSLALISGALLTQEGWPLQGGTFLEIVNAKKHSFHMQTTFRAHIPNDLHYWAQFRADFSLPWLSHSQVLDNQYPRAHWNS